MGFGPNLKALIAPTPHNIKNSTGIVHRQFLPFNIAGFNYRPPEKNRPGPITAAMLAEMAKPLIAADAGQAQRRVAANAPPASTTLLTFDTTKANTLGGTV